MKFYANRSRVGTAGTAVALSAASGAPDSKNKIKYIKVSARTGNSGVVYFGDSTVAATLGYELSANDSVEIDLLNTTASLPFADFYADASANNQDLDWVIVVE
jgi:hypothetical protein|tara:strand:- start:4945 stop:5253 length:309 start_codon:yes stop_codon:yes gene_type:complete